MCGYHTKNVFHFFFECVQFSEQRLSLFEHINALQLQVPISLELLLYGNNNFNSKDNSMIFNFFFKITSLKVKGFNNTVKICKSNALIYILTSICI
jgi:hypothetical protein